MSVSTQNAVPAQSAEPQPAETNGSAEEVEMPPGFLYKVSCRHAIVALHVWVSKPIRVSLLHWESRPGLCVPEWRTADA